MTRKARFEDDAGLRISELFYRIIKNLILAAKVSQKVDVDQPKSRINLFSDHIPGIV